MEVITLQPEEQEALFMQSVYMKNGFKSARVSTYARNLMDESLEKLKRREVDVIIGGCTEVSTGVDPSTLEFPYIDALDLLARGTVACCYNASLVKQ
jgi:aspartate racemase